MELDDLARAIPNFPRLTHPEKIKAFAWHVHTHKKMDRFNPADIRSCYDHLHYAKPDNISSFFLQLQQKKPPVLLKDPRGYRLEGRVREAYDAKYGPSHRTKPERVFGSLPLRLGRSLAFPK